MEIIDQDWEWWEATQVHWLISALIRIHPDFVVVLHWWSHAFVINYEQLHMWCQQKTPFRRVRISPPPSLVEFHKSGFESERFPRINSYKKNNKIQETFDAQGEREWRGYYLRIPMQKGIEKVVRRVDSGLSWYKLRGAMIFGTCSK
jgi:hypothetical protein